jgi:outer membrane lipoprotein-sorting protein
MTRRNLNCLIASAAGGALCAGERDAAGILLRTAEVYPALTSYLFDGKSVTENTIGGKSFQTALEFTAAFQAPNKFRLEFRYGNGGDWLRVSDGEFLLESRSNEKESKRSPATEWTIRALKSSPVANFERLSQTAQNPVLARSETLNVDDKATDCDVIQFASHRRELRDNETPGPSLAWVAKDSGLVLREEICTSALTGKQTSQSKRTTTIKQYRFNVDLPPETFRTDATKKA